MPCTNPKAPRISPAHACHIGRVGFVLSNCSNMGASCSLLSNVILPRPRRNQRRIYWLKLKLRLVRIRSEARFSGLHPVLVVALWEVGFVMRAARFVPQARALGDHTRKLQHVVELTDKRHSRIRPLRA